MPPEKTKRILIAPLDWGLGHTSRCLPIIQYLRGLGHHVVVAGNEWQRQFINKSCQGIETIHLDGYDVSYGKKGNGFLLSMFRQMPKLLTAVRKEHDWLIEQSAKAQFDGIISDNRYGLFHKHIPSVIMTHQLQVRSGMGHIPDEILRKMHYKFLQRFGKCWVVDVAGEKNLGGKLSHPKSLPVNTHYIGLLSQFDISPATEGSHLLVLLSGPEPQRTLLSDLLWKQLLTYKGKIVFVEGSNNVKRTMIPSHVSYHNQITKSELQPLLEQASMVICRSGYSTLMDLVAQGKKAIVVPTPGQTEQLYLAKHLHRQGVFYAAAQKTLQLQKRLDDAKRFPFKQLSLQHSFDQYKSVINNWLETI